VVTFCRCPRNLPPLLAEKVIAGQLDAHDS
jgi:hypothetical protein